MVSPGLTLCRMSPEICQKRNSAGQGCSNRVCNCSRQRKISASSSKVPVISSVHSAALSGVRGRKPVTDRVTPSCTPGGRALINSVRPGFRESFSASRSAVRCLISKRSIYTSLMSASDFALTKRGKLSTTPAETREVS